jgi:phage shock protein PspC (stress-responsive transcriptional regulator)
MSTEQSPGEQPDPLPQPGPEARPTTGGQGPAPRPLPPRGGDFFGWIRGLGIVRGSDRWMGGVASGLAHRWGVDPILVRGLFIVAAIFLGVGVLAYGLLWLLLPEPDGRIHAQEAAHGRWTAGMTGGIIVTVIGLGGARAGFWFGDRGIGGAFWGLFWIAVVGFAIFSVMRGSRRRTAYREAAAHGPGATVPPATPPTPSPRQAEASQDVPFAAGVPGAGDAADTKPGTPPSYGDAHPSGGFPAGAAHGTAAPAADGVPYYGPPQAGPAQPAPPYYGAASYGAPHYGGPYVPVRTVARPPRRPRPSAPYVLVVLGAAALAAGTLGALIATGVLALSAGAVWTAVVVVLGLGILVSGLRGRRAGILTVFAIVALVGSAVSQGADRLASVHSRPIASSPTSLQEAEKGYDIAMSRGSLDLSALDGARPLASQAVVPVKATMSDLTITVPKDVPVEVRTSTTLADVTANGQSFTGISRHDTTTYNSATTGPALVVELDATLSSVTINEEH